ncbi:alpha/beta hydrolase [Pullulanibacillus sp. KACC 23026]|uniref:alpha/beta hydrolase n=1 Tax=Pullulanibacillus sp. KACC 23026 TaxID=3028315 RepID=UPI0023B15CD8|nr:alpha/beta hydrolase [Pullulanibacillus sp. KACC 23026]WEG13708.1 alpha/beta hydrolase [Pullulanibacillus sp. KACC 23026]
MISETYNLWIKEAYTYPVMGDFIPTITSYIHEDDKVRPAMIVVPGGGYSVVSPTEGELVAMEFYQKGYNAFVVTYTTNLLRTTPLKFQPLKDLSKAVVFVRKQAELFCINPDKVAVCGFSAGGHLTGSLAVHYDAEELVLGEEYAGIRNRPNAVILSYPVITSGDFAHKDSFIALLGEEASQEELDYMSLEKQVTDQTPPVFIWHTVSDETVPVENSYLFAESCKNHGVPFEHHVFGNGPHGLSLANTDWATGNYGQDYTLNQVYETMQYLVDHGLDLPSPFNRLGPVPKGTDVKEILRLKSKENRQDLKPDEGIAIWPTLVHNWLKKTWGLAD